MAEQVGTTEELGRQVEPALLVVHRLRAQHQPREVELPLVGRDVRALHVAELALVALVDHLVLLRLRHRRRVAAVLVDEVEQRREQRAQVPAESAAVAEVVDAGELLAQIGFVAVCRVPRVVDDGQLTSSRPLVKRPAWLFSARASVSNHWPISSNPSSRAVRAKPGYISVYS